MVFHVSSQVCDCITQGFDVVLNLAFQALGIGRVVRERAGENYYIVSDL